MAKDIEIGSDLFDLLSSHNFDVDVTDERGQAADPAEGKVFKFDWAASSGNNYGTAVLVIGDDNELMLFYGDNLGRGMEPEDKDEWFSFMKQLKDFSVRHNFLTFSPKNINALKHTMTGMAAIKEGLFEGYYGNRRISYMGEATEARLVIRHNRMIGENDKRYRYVESLFIETVDGERFRLPFNKLVGGRAMLEHVRQGGRPYDIRGQHITETVNELAVLSRFRRAQQGRVFEGHTQALVEQANHYYEALRHNLNALSTARGYSQYFEFWTPAQVGEQESLVEDLRNMFVQQTLDARIEQALPTLAKISQGNGMKEAQIFENWVNQVMEGTWALPDTPESQGKLKELMSQPLIVGPDATNATEQLYDVIGDDELFDRLSELAEQDPRANVWDDTEIQQRMAELGIQMDQPEPAAEPAADQAAPDTAPEQSVTEGTLDYDKVLNAIAALYGDDIWDNDAMQDLANDLEQAKPTDRELDFIIANGKLPRRLANTQFSNNDDVQFGEQSVAESTELAAMLRHAGVPVAESVLTDSTGHTLDHIMKRFSREVAEFKKGADLDQDLYDALYDYYFDDMPYGVKKARTGDPYEWVTDRFDQELGTGNYGARLPEGDNLATFEVMSGFDAPVAEGSCNMTAEGQYCPEHGLAECAMEEGWKGELAGGTAGGVAGTLAGTAVGGPIGGVVGGALGGTAGAMLGRNLTKDDSTDPMDHRGAVTDSFYESELARIKSLALLK